MYEPNNPNQELAVDARQFNLGDKCEDAVSGYTGTIMAVCRYLDGTTSVAVQGMTCGTDGRPAEWYWFDIRRCRAERGLREA